MIELKKQQHIRFAKVERPHAWVVVAVLVETIGDETTAISEPKIVKIIPKVIKALSGSTPSTLLLASPKQIIRVATCVVSPYISNIFGYTSSGFSIAQAAQPPTVA